MKLEVTRRGAMTMAQKKVSFSGNAVSDLSIHHLVYYALRSYR